MAIPAEHDTPASAVATAAAKARTASTARTGSSSWASGGAPNVASSRTPLLSITTELTPSRSPTTCWKHATTRWAASGATPDSSGTRTMAMLRRRNSIVHNRRAASPAVDGGGFEGVVVAAAGVAAAGTSGTNGRSRATSSYSSPPIGSVAASPSSSVLTAAVKVTHPGRQRRSARSTLDTASPWVSSTHSSSTPPATVRVSGPAETPMRVSIGRPATRWWLPTAAWMASAADAAATEALRRSAGDESDSHRHSSESPAMSRTSPP